MVEDDREMGDVTPINRGGTGGNPPHDRWLRRQALHLVAQLPDDTSDAMKIIDQMTLLMRVFVDPPLSS